jgi:hypothetical protein
MLEPPSIVKRCSTDWMMDELQLKADQPLAEPANNLTNSVVF